MRISGLAFIGLKALSNDNDGKLKAKASDENIVPWTIVNRYYIADVHFATHVIHGLSPLAFDKPHTPPAVIYVWVDGEVCSRFYANQFIPFLRIYSHMLNTSRNYPV